MNRSFGSVLRSRNRLTFDHLAELASICNFQRAYSKVDTVRQSHDHTEYEDEDPAVEFKSSEKVQEEFSIPPQTRDMMKKIALANTDIVNFVVANL